MKIIIITEGGRRIGFGHLTRCISLAQAFEEAGIRADFIVNGDETVRGFLKGKRYQIFDWLKEKVRVLRMTTKADIVVVDSYLAKKDIYDEISDMTNGRIIMIDDYNRIEYPKGLVVNPSIYGDRLNYPQKEGIVYLLGKDYVILRKEFWKIPRKIVRQELKDILITFGGKEHRNFIKGLLKFLSQHLPNFNYHIVNSNPAFNVNLNPNFNLYRNLSSLGMRNLMFKCDLAISSGGQTLYELARVGVPAIGICFAENQRLNLEGWHKEGFVEYIGWYNGENLLKKIQSGINKFIPYKERVRCYKIGRNSITGKGAIRVADRIL